MTADSFAYALRILCSQTPIRAFVIELHSGQQLSIHHPEAIALRKHVWIYVTPAGAYHFLDHASVCQVVLQRDSKPP